MATWGTATKLYANGYDVTTYFKEAGIELGRDAADVTTFGDTAYDYIPGLRFAEQTMDGFYDPVNSDPNYGSTTVLYPIFNSTTQNAVLCSFAPIGDTFSYPVYCTYGQATTYGIAVEMTEATPLAVAIASNIGGKRHLSYKAMAAVTATANGTSIDNTSSTAYGGSAALHVTVVSGTNPTLDVKIQHSTDNSTWADLITFTQVTADNQSEYKTTATPTTTVNRYTRAIWTVGGTDTPTFTFYVGFGRNFS